MKCILSIILLFGCMRVADAQSSLPIDLIMEELAEHGAKVSVARVNERNHLSRRYQAAFDDNPLLADSICRFLDEMARSAVESYRYESHRNGNDTITYSIALCGYGANDDYLLDLDRVEDIGSYWTNDYTDYCKTHSYFYPNPYMMQDLQFFRLLKGNNRRMYFGAREAALFDYVLGHGNLIAMITQANEAQGMYYHFDIAPLDSLLQSLERGHAVHYRHEAGRPIDKAATYYYTDYLLPKSKGASESRGTLYTVGPEQGAADLYRTLLGAAQHHLDVNPTQCCVLEYTNRHFKLSGIKNTTKYHVNEIAESSFLMADLDKSGTLYVLRLDVDGEYWIPKNWKQIK
ncbi:MAG: hypothetical protein IJV06_01220 [Bacteroidaceae bacterium]|nr:hypothetical protein [Bacteroidaceae bacterium]